MILEDNDHKFHSSMFTPRIKTTFVVSTMILAIVIGCFFIHKDSEQSMAIFNQNYSLAEEYFNKKNYVDAVVYYQKALEYYPEIDVQTEIERKIAYINSINASLKFYNDGLIYSQNNQYLSAYTAFQKVIPEDKERYQQAQTYMIENKNKYIQSRLNYARELLKNGKYNGAIAEIESILNTDSQNQEAVKLKAECYAAKNEARFLKRPLTIKLVAADSRLSNVYGADSIDDLNFYLENRQGPYGQNPTSYDLYAMANELFKKDRVFLLSTSHSYILLEYDDSFNYAKVQFTESCFKKRSGDKCWVLESCIVK